MVGGKEGYSSFLAPPSPRSSLLLPCFSLDPSLFSPPYSLLPGGAQGKRCFSLLPPPFSLDPPLSFLLSPPSSGGAQGKRCSSLLPPLFSFSSLLSPGGAQGKRWTRATTGRGGVPVPRHHPNHKAGREGIPQAPSNPQGAAGRQSPGAPPPGGGRWGRGSATGDSYIYLEVIV